MEISQWDMVGFDLQDIIRILDLSLQCVDPMDECSIAFLDCRGYYDLAAEIISIIISLAVLIYALHGHHQLQLQLRLSPQEQVGPAFKKKAIMLMNIAFISVFLVRAIFSMIIFTIINEEDGQGIQTVKEHRMNLWYQFVNVTVMELLNILILIIGKLYWQALFQFYDIKELETPPLYSKYIKHLINILIGIQSSIIALSFVDSFFDSYQLQKVTNLLVLGSQIISIVVFLFYRLKYYSNIFRSVKLHRTIIRKEQIYNVLIVGTSLARAALCLIQEVGLSLEGLRKYDPKSKCHDVLPWHSICLLLVRVLIDLLPSFVFVLIFGINPRNQSQIEQTLFSKADESSSGF